jgi:uncharacterized repeat protein (TIGR01451 family)
VSADIALTGRAVHRPATGMTFVLRLKNKGPARAQDVLLRDTLPARTSFGHVEGASGCRLKAATRVLRCPLGPLGAGKARIVRVQTWLQGSPRKLVNEARVSSTAPDLAPANNRARLVVRLR